MPALALPFVAPSPDEQLGFAISKDRIGRAKSAYATRHVPFAKMRRLLNGVCPAPGDLGSGEGLLGSVSTSTSSLQTGVTPSCEKTTR